MRSVPRLADVIFTSVSSADNPLQYVAQHEIKMTMYLRFRCENATRSRARKNDKGARMSERLCRERTTGFEPATHLGKVMLYQLSHVRVVTEKSTSPVP